MFLLVHAGAEHQACCRHCTPCRENQPSQESSGGDVKWVSYCALPIQLLKDHISFSKFKCIVPQRPIPTLREVNLTFQGEGGEGRGRDEGVTGWASTVNQKKKIQESRKLNWNFQRSRRVHIKKKPSVESVWIFSRKMQLYWHAFMLKF